MLLKMLVTCIWFGICVWIPADILRWWPIDMRKPMRWVYQPLPCLTVRFSWYKSIYCSIFILFPLYLLGFRTWCRVCPSYFFISPARALYIIHMFTYICNTSVSFRYCSWYLYISYSSTTTSFKWNTTSCFPSTISSTSGNGKSSVETKTTGGGTASTTTTTYWGMKGVLSCCPSMACTRSLRGLW